MKKSLATLAVLSLSFSSFAQITQMPKNQSQTRAKKQVQVRTNAKGDIMESMGSEDEPENWYNLSPELDRIEGVSTEQAYEHFGAPASEIIVAVIDSGVDVNHEDLQGKVWINEDEIPGNGIDDDMNGYIDDVFGWNFIGNSKGMAKIIAENNLNGLRLIKGDPALQVGSETLEITREVVRLKKLKEELNAKGEDLTKEDQEKLEEVSKEVNYERKRLSFYVDHYGQELSKYQAAKKVLEEAGLSEISNETVINFKPQNPEQRKAQSDMLTFLGSGETPESLAEIFNYYNTRYSFYYNTELDNRADIVKDDISNKDERNYGNNDIIGPDSSHGTHVAGIIAAARHNGIGSNGVASNVKIMAIRAIPDGDERDKDVANSIYYAVDNGARVINMSFGKAFSPYKNVVDKAMRYAESKGVLLVHAAGNSAQNNDVEPNFPNNKSALKLTNWIEVGASSYLSGPYLAAGFSNFGKSSVDIFAPGKNIHAPFPDDTYNTISGTSMASPVVAGVAAALLGHYPEMSAQTAKSVLLKSSTTYPTLEVHKEGVGKILFSQLSISGGIVNLFSALNLAQEYVQPPFRLQLAAN